MDYCGERGIPHSEFLCWEESDQDSAVAWLIKKRESCPGCGTKTDDWYDGEGRLVEPPPYVVSSKRCPGCADLHEYRSQDEVQKNSAGLFVSLKPYDEEEDDSDAIEDA